MKPKHDINSAGWHSTNTHEWTTPRAFFDKLDRLYRFTLDAAATHDNALCSTYFTKEIDGLEQDWGSHRVWCNPPYGPALPAWTRKCWEASQAGALVVMLVPARTGPRWFRDYVQGKAQISFLPGKLCFGNPKYPEAWPAPFYSMLCVYGGDLPATCRRCGDYFETKRSHALTCSNACRQAMHRRNTLRAEVLS
jgi:site-specific DNA-methyltransferase (adenine-specific)